MAADRSERMYPTRPLVGVGAVVLKDHQVLLERRGQPPAEGNWSIPGGLIELGERAEDAVRREVMEECNIAVEVGPVLGIFEPIHRDSDARIRYHFVVVDYVAFYQHGEIAAGDDAAALAWVAPQELDGYALLPATRAMIERALALARDHAGGV